MPAPEFGQNMQPYPGEVDPAHPRRGLDLHPAPHVLDLQPSGSIDGLTSVPILKFGTLVPSA